MYEYFEYNMNNSVINNSCYKYDYNIKNYTCNRYDYNYDILLKKYTLTRQKIIYLNYRGFN